MKQSFLTLLMLVFLAAVAHSGTISPETGETIPQHVLNDPYYSMQAAPGDSQTRDVGSWTGSGPWGGNVRSIIADPANPMHMFAACGFNLATVVGGVYASNDGGVNWQATTLQGKPYYALAASAAQQGTFYAGARNGLYKSVDNGLNWTPAGLSTIFILSLGVKANDGNTIIVGKSSNVGIVVSTDGGTNFNQVGVNAGFMRQFAYSDANPERMFIVMGSSTSSVLTSIDNGQSWSSYGPAGDGWGMWVSPTDSLFSLVAHANGIYRSTDGGANWTMTAGGTFRSVTEYNGTFFATSNTGGVYQSNDLGVSWQPYNVGVVQSTWQAAASGGAGALLGFWGGIFRATGYQVPLTASHTGMNAAFVHGLAYFSDTNELWAGTEGSGIYKSTDNGATWTQMVNGLNSWMVYAMAPSNHQFYQSGRMLAGTLNGVYTSLDNGNTWTFVDYPANQCSALEVHPTDPDQFWIGTSAGEIKYTDDGGQTWTVATGGMFGFAPSLKLGRNGFGGLRLFLSYQGSATAVWYSDDNGATFTASTGMAGTTYQTMVAPRPALGMQQQIVYASSDLGIFRSLDNGQTYTQSGMTGFCWSVMCSSGQQVISGKENGLDYSTNEAQSSSSLTQNLTSTTVWQLAWGSSTNQVFIATRGKGVMEYRFNDLEYGIPAGLTAIPGHQQVTLDWTQVTTQPEPTHYILWRDGYPLTELASNVSAYTDINLVNGQTYHYFVSAVYEGNIETLPVQIIAATPVETQLLPPTDLVASYMAPDTINLSWNHPEPMSPDLTSYRIYRDGEHIFTHPAEYNPAIGFSGYTAGTYSFYVTAVYTQGESEPSNTSTVTITGNEDETQVILPVGIASVSPNPFRTAVTISYQNKTSQDVQIEIYNARGQLITRLSGWQNTAGMHNAVWNGCDRQGNSVSNGVYYFRLVSPDGVSVRKALLLK